MRDFQNLFLTRFKELRTEKGLSLKQMDAKTGVNAAKIERIEKNVNEPTRDAIVAYCIKHDVSADWLLGFSDERTPVRGGVSNTATGKHSVAVSGGVSAPINTGGAADNSDLKSEMAVIRRDMEFLKSAFTLLTNQLKTK